MKPIHRLITHPSRTARVSIALALTASSTLLLACAHVAPSELVDARTAYARAADGPAEEYTPAELHVANESLLVAERSFNDKDDPALVRDLSYIAMRQVERAESAARTIMHERGLDATEQREERLEDAAASATRDQLGRTEDQLGRAEDANAASATALETEKQARAAAELRAKEAEARADKARADLARIGAVKQVDNGMIITLSGSVLFSTNQFELRPAAQAKLSEVALALLAGDPGATFVVTGHTDSQGTSDSNQTLSLNRANAVREYLVGHDIAADRITAQGGGEELPVADNGSAEGRANNRRVEIAVTNPK